MNYAIYVHNSGVYVLDNKCTGEDCQKFFSWKEDDELKDFFSSFAAQDKVYLVLDVIDEDLDPSWKAKLLPWEKISFIKEEKSRILRTGVSFLHVKWTNLIKSSTEGRAEELLYRMVIHKNDRLDDVIDAIEKSKLRLEGIYSIVYLIECMFKATLVKKINLSDNELLKPFFLIMRISKYRFRILFLLDKMVLFSKEADISKKHKKEVDIQKVLTNELTANSEYIYINQIIPLGSTISVVLIDDNDDGSSSWTNTIKDSYVNPLWKDPHTFFCKITSLTFIAKELGLKQLDCSGELLMSSYVLKNKLPSFYQSPYQQAIERLKKMISGFVFANVVLFFCAVIVVSYLGISNYFKQQKLELYQEQQTAFTNKKIQLQKQVNLSLDARDIKATVQFSNKLKKLNAESPIGIDFYSLSQVLANSKNIVLSKVSWDTGTILDSDFYQVSLKGLVLPFNKTYKPLVVWVDEFVEELKKLPKYKDVVLLEEPLERSITKVLTIDSSKSVEALSFTITLKIDR